MPFAQKIAQLQPPACKIKVRHSLAIIFDNDVILVGVDDKQPTEASGVVCDGPDLLKDLRGMMMATPPLFSNICLMAPISLAVSIPYDPVFLCPTSHVLPHVFQEFRVRCTCVAGTRVDVHVVLQEDAEHS